jgi:hypothetical protein
MVSFPVVLRKPISISLALRDLDGAAGALQQALAIAVAIDNPTQVWKIHLAWARLRPDRADDAYRAARAVLDGITAGLQEPSFRASLGAVPAVREVYAGAGSS